MRHDLDRLTYTAPEAAQVLGISAWLAYKMCADGRLPTIDCGRRRVIPKVALERVLSEAGR
jgi:excisionase family DNA binding protein